MSPTFQEFQHSWHENSGTSFPDTKGMIYKDIIETVRKLCDWFQQCKQDVDTQVRACCSGKHRPRQQFSRSDFIARGSTEWTTIEQGNPTSTPRSPVFPASQE